MLAVCLNLLVILCLHWTTLSRAASGGVQWKETGHSITIQCRGKASDKQEYLDLRKGLHAEDKVLYFDSASNKESIAEGYQKRLQTHGLFPNIEILIKHLSPNDTGPYWCLYKKYNSNINKLESAKGNGSVLLVVKEPARDEDARDKEVKECGSSSQDLLMMCAVIVGAVLLLIFTIFFIWIIRKNRSGDTQKKPRRVATNDVYEEMRGTVRP